jgi:hypothetical protein
LLVKAFSGCSDDIGHLTGGRGIHEVPEEPVLEANIAFSFASSAGSPFFRSCELYLIKPSGNELLLS